MVAFFRGLIDLFFHGRVSSRLQDSVFRIIGWRRLGLRALRKHDQESRPSGADESPESDINVTDHFDRSIPFGTGFLQTFINLTFATSGRRQDPVLKPR